jgi:hypothetical protein
MGLEDVADRMAEAAQGDRVSVGDLVSAVGRHAFAPLLLVLGLISLSPLGSIPGASITLGALIILVAMPALMGRQSPWLPGLLLHIHIKGSKARASVKWLKPRLARIDRLLEPRWPGLLRPVFRRIVALLCIVLAILMYPLAVVPWGVVAPSFAIVVLSLGLSSRDGLVVAVGLVVTVVALGVSLYLIREMAVIY